MKKTPHGITVEEIKEHISEIDGVIDVHHIHLWSLDGQSTYATMHIVANSDSMVKQKIKQQLKIQFSVTLAHFKCSVTLDSTTVDQILEYRS